MLGLRSNKEFANEISIKVRENQDTLEVAGISASDVNVVIHV
jgi:hypothetical protein